MKTLNVSISDVDYKRFGIKKDELSFDDFMDIVNRKMAQETLRECVKQAKKYGLDKMTMAEIDEEIKAVRENAKTRH